MLSLIPLFYRHFLIFCLDTNSFCNSISTCQYKNRNVIKTSWSQAVAWNWASSAVFIALIYRAHSHWQKHNIASVQKMWLVLQFFENRLWRNYEKSLNNNWFCCEGAQSWEHDRLKQSSYLNTRQSIYSFEMTSSLRTVEGRYLLCRWSNFQFQQQHLKMV